VLVRVAAGLRRAEPISSFRSFGANPRSDVLGKPCVALWSARPTDPTVTGPDALARAILPEKMRLAGRHFDLARDDALSKDFITTDEMGV